MGLPTLNKTWRILPNVVLATTGVASSDCQQLLFTIKDLLVTPGNYTWFDANGDSATAPPAWTVSRSSDSSSVANSDLWTDRTKLVHADSSTAHSWIVLNNSAISANFRMCLDYCGGGGGAGNYHKMYPGNEGANPATSGFGGLYATGVPLSTFTDGTITDRARGSSEIQLYNRRSAGQLWMGRTGTFQAVVHAFRSTDGQCTRVVYYTGGACVGFLFVDVPQYPAAGAYTWNSWNVPFVGGWFCTQDYTIATQNALRSDTASSPAWLYYYNSMSTVGTGSTQQIYWTSPAYATDSATLGSNTATINAVNSVSGKYPMSPIGLSVNSGADKAFLGMLSDIWAVPTVLADGDCFPAAGTRKFVVFGDFAFPWCGKVPVLT